MWKAFQETQIFFINPLQYLRINYPVSELLSINKEPYRTRQAAMKSIET